MADLNALIELVTTCIYDLTLIQSEFISNFIKRVKTDHTVSSWL